jgi:hypothetical protein
MKLIRELLKVSLLSIKSSFTLLVLSTPLLAQNVSTSIDILENQITTTEYESGWTVAETFKPSIGGVSRCVIRSSFNAPMALELIITNDSLDVIIWDGVFGNAFKSGEWFTVSIESNSYNFEKRFKYRGTSDAVTWWDLPNNEAEDVINILRYNGRMTVYYDGVGSRNLKLIGNEDAIILLSECRNKIEM